MSYTPTNWKAGDTVTSAKLNKMEQGIADNDSRAIIATWNFASYILNKTWEEIYNGNYSTIIIEKSEGQTYEKTLGKILKIGYYTYDNNLQYCIEVDQESFDSKMIYLASSETDYPACYIGPMVA